VHRGGDADAAGLGQPLETRGDVHSVPSDPPTFCGDIAHVNADAKVHSALGREDRGELAFDGLGRHAPPRAVWETAR